jgi:hypothetical protein
MSVLLNLQKVCAEFDFPDFSLFLASDGSTPACERCKVVWGILKSKLTLEKRREFLRAFCDRYSDRVSSLRFLSVFITEDMSDQQCDSSFGLFGTMPGIDEHLVAFTGTFCTENNLQHVAELIAGNPSPEDVVYQLERLFISERDGEGLLRAVDELKFEVNPERFVRGLDRKIKEDLDLMATMTGPVDKHIARLTAEKLDLEEQVSGSLPSTPKTPGSVSPPPAAAAAPPPPPAAAAASSSSPGMMVSFGRGEGGGRDFRRKRGNGRPL